MRKNSEHVIRGGAAGGTRYVPALGVAVFTGLYDTVLALTMRERRWRPRLCERIAAHLPRGGRIVDVGAGELELEDASADAVVMSLLLRHLDPAGKHRALTDARRALRPDGRLHVADWGRPHNPVMRARFAVVQLVDGRDGTRGHAAGRLPAFLAQAGFARAERSGRLRTGFGSLDLIEARG